jgi:uncharacterized radical SAM superfamily protein
MAGRPALFENGRLNPGYLKLDLFCRGLRLAEDCVLQGRQGAKRVRAGLGSGLELRIEGAGGMTVNAPVLEPFAAGSPYELHGPDAQGLHAIHSGGRVVATVRLPEEPSFYARTTSSGKPMGSVGTLQGTYLGVYYGMLCANWKRPGEDACRFCAVGTHVGEGDERTDKSPADVVETALAAAAERGITFVHLNGGFDDSGAYIERFAPVVEKLRRETGLLIGVQIPPLTDFADYQRLRDMGVNNLSLCFELWDGERFREVCPGKDRRAGLERYLDAIRHCAQDVGFDTTNGELIAGLEAPERSLEAIDWLTETGAVPTVCVFRPLAGTAYAERQPPETEALVPVFAHLYRRCMQAGLPIGVAPGIQVSIVLTPDECRWLLPPGERGGWRLRRLKHAALRRALGSMVARRQRRATSHRRVD